MLRRRFSYQIFFQGFKRFGENLGDSEYIFSKNLFFGKLAIPYFHFTIFITIII